VADDTFNRAFKKVFFALPNQGNNRAKAGFATGDTLHILQYLSYIGGMVTLRTCITGRVYARFAL
jgi:hypothetical protein